MDDKETDGGESKPTIASLRKLIAKSKRLRKSFAKGQTVKILEPMEIVVTKGKAHLSFSGRVEWGKTK